MRRPSSSAEADADHVWSTDFAGLSSEWIASARAASASRSILSWSRETSTWPTLAAGGVPPSQPASAARATSETRRATRRRTKRGCYVVPGPPQSPVASVLGGRDQLAQEVDHGGGEIRRLGDRQHDQLGLLLVDRALEEAVQPHHLAGAEGQRGHPGGQRGATEGRTLHHVQL